MISFSSRDMGIDLGTANTIIYMKEKGIILNEPSVIAYDKNIGEIIATGQKAKDMYGKTPANIIVVKPLQDGVISDFDMTSEMLQRFIKRSLGERKPSGLRVVVGVPSGVTEVEKRAVEEVVRQMGAREVYILDEPTAAAIGAGLNIDTSEASMIADIGGGTTDIAILAMGGIVVSTSLRYAGDKFNEAVIQYIRKKKGVLIGDKTAEELKINVGSALVDKDTSGEENLYSMKARGRDLISGLPKTFEVSNKDMEAALYESMELIIDALKSTVEKAPPEIAADIAEKGMVLSGGGGMIENLDKLISQRTGMIVEKAKDPQEAVALGTGKSLDNIEKLRKYVDAKKR
ncbi:MAG TPA: rod shape-determining protein [Bacillota bacterium]|nr:rod shape-determining protein [Bacillota bacterium]HUM55738.1 rod shape-determining protein [Bacillota bacterium]